ncbi:MAG: HPP family protein [Hyphomicrobiales bacterium]|nr:HPP family protein [Hyphomicrobiales bacterium]
MNKIGATGALARFWSPLLLGARLPDRLGAALAAMLGIVAAAALSGLAARHALYPPLIIAPLGASAVLIFAVPASPLAQPWSAFGGNVISSLVALAVCRVITDPLLATGVAVATAIVAMSLARCLHPPGGAVALLTALGAGAPHGLDFFNALSPVALNTGLLVVCAWIYHKAFSGHSWPHVASLAPAHGTRDPAPAYRYLLQDADIQAAVDGLHESFDISRDDLVDLLRQVELQAFTRAHGAARCGDVMSRDIVTLAPTDTMRMAADVSRTRGLRIMPVVNKANIVVGVLEAPELIAVCDNPDALVASVMRDPLTAAPDKPVFALLGTLSEGRAHGALIVDPDRRLLGLITQTDLLAAVAHSALFAETAGARPAP